VTRHKGRRKDIFNVADLIGQLDLLGAGWCPPPNMSYRALAHSHIVSLTLDTIALSPGGLLVHGDAETDA
jgi:hypothetical protein